MTPNGVRLLFPAVFSALVLSACAAPSPIHVTTSAPTPVSDRPRSISMAGLDPCTVFTDDQLRQLGVDARDRYPKPASAYCSWVTATTDALTGVSAQAVTSLGMDDILQRISDPTTSLDVRGFHAVLWEHSLDVEHPSFQLFVDVSDGQILQVAVALRGAKNRDKAMHDTQRAADFAIANLLSR